MKLGILVPVCLGVAAANHAGTGFLLVSSPRQSQVHYAPLLTAAQQAKGEQLTLRALTAAGQVRKPMGLAVDSFRRMLYVADASLKAILAMRVAERQAGTLTIEEPVAVLRDVNAEWVAVDSLGTIFYTDASRSSVFALSGEAATRRYAGLPSEEGATVLASLDAMAPLRSPRGVAADGRKAYWAAEGGSSNQGHVVGMISDTSGDRGRVAPMANTTEVPHGLCLTGSHAFFTASRGRLLAAPLALTENNSTNSSVVVSSLLQSPRGCAYDGDGTVFVADQGAGRVYAVSGGGSKLGARPLVVALEVPDAYGLAVYSGATLPRPACAFVAAATIWVLVAGI